MPKNPKTRARSRTKSKSKGSTGKRGKSRGKAKTVKSPEPTLKPLPPPVEPPKPKVRPKGTCFAAITPGPGEYAATSLVGYFDHDPTKTREPAFSFASGGRNMKKPQEKVPGPIYNCDDVTRFGPISQNGPVIIGRQVFEHKGHLTPGPGHYSPEKYDNPRYHNAPEARLLGRHCEDKTSKFTPGPSDYDVRSSDIEGPGARIIGRSWDKKNKRPLHFTPGPNQYAYDNSAYLKSGPTALILGREKQNRTAMRDSGPGPGAYYFEFNEAAKSPSFSFGIRHAPCVFVPTEKGDDCF